MKRTFLFLFAAILTLLGICNAAPAATPTFPGVAWKFAGLYKQGNAATNITIGARGHFTGVVIFADGHRDILAGTLSNTGTFSGMTGPSHTPYSLTVTGTAPPNYMVTGSAEGTTITALPAVYDSPRVSATEAGTYTLALTNTETAISTPQGNGFGTLVITRTGASVFHGTLGDGTPVVTSGFLVSGTEFHDVALFDTSVYGGKGFVSSLVHVGDPASGQLSGPFRWHKQHPAGHVPYYPDGFDVTGVVTGATYVASPAPFVSGTITTTGSFAGSPLSSVFTITRRGVTLTGTNYEHLTFSFPTGRFNGTLKSNGGEPISFHGAIIDEPISGAGYFLTPTRPATSGTGLSGDVFVYPAVPTAE